MLKCWSYSPDDRPTFLYCLEVLKLLQLHTSDSIQITVQFPSWAPNGKIFFNDYFNGHDACIHLCHLTSHYSFYSC